MRVRLQHETGEEVIEDNVTQIMPLYETGAAEAGVMLIYSDGTSAKFYGSAPVKAWQDENTEREYHNEDD